jgi:acetyl-CoA C-acetyltransferase
MAVVVSKNIWTSLGKPRGLRLIAHAARGVSPDNEAAAPIEAMQKLKAIANAYKPSDIGVIEMSESSAAQAIALIRSLEIEEDLVNPDGGALARGHPFAASSSVLVTRLFTRLARGENKGPPLGVATLGVAGGMGVAALFESV